MAIARGSRIRRSNERHRALAVFFEIVSGSVGGSAGKASEKGGKQGQITA